MDDRLKVVAELVLSKLLDQLSDPEMLPWVEPIFVTGHPCCESYEQMLDAYSRLRQRLGVENEDIATITGYNDTFSFLCLCLLRAEALPAHSRYSVNTCGLAGWLRQWCRDFCGLSTVQCGCICCPMGPSGGRNANATLRTDPSLLSALSPALCYLGSVKV